MAVMRLFQPHDLKLIDDDEPRILDIRLGERLELSRARNIKKTIEDNLNELAGLGRICCIVQQITGVGRPGTEYWLTEEQAIVICMRSDAPKGPEVRAEIAHVFKSWRHGRLASANSAPVLLNAISGLKNDIHGVKEDILDVKENVVFLSKGLENLSDRFDDHIPRKNFSAEVHSIWISVLRLPEHGGRCPCGCGERIVDATGSRIKGVYSEDHWYGHGLCPSVHALGTFAVSLDRMAA